jgi:hypothetical protein
VQRNSGREAGFPTEIVPDSYLEVRVIADCKSCQNDSYDD